MVGEKKFEGCLIFILHQNEQWNFLRRKKEIFRISPSSLLPPTCCFLLDVWQTLFNSPPDFFQTENWMKMFQGEVAEMWLAEVLGSSAWIRVCWGWRVFAGVDRPQAVKACYYGSPDTPISADIWGNFTSPFSSVLQKWAPECIFYKKPFPFDSVFQWNLVFIKRSHLNCM